VLPPGSSSGSEDPPVIAESSPKQGSSSHPFLILFPTSSPPSTEASGDFSVILSPSEKASLFPESPLNVSRLLSVFFHSLTRIPDQIFGLTISLTSTSGGGVFPHIALSAFTRREKRDPLRSLFSHLFFTRAAFFFFIRCSSASIFPEWGEGVGRPFVESTPINIPFYLTSSNLLLWSPEVLVPSNVVKLFPRVPPSPRP